MSNPALSISIASSADEVLACFNVLKQLRTQLDEESFLDQVDDLQQYGYTLVALRDLAMHSSPVVAVCGYKFLYSLARGKMLYIDDFATDTTLRSKGYGSALMQWVVQQGAREQCSHLLLDSSTQRIKAHKFYLNQGFHIQGFHFSYDY